MDAQTERPQPQPARHRYVLLLVLVILLITYIVSYFWISRVRWNEYRQMRVPGFYYLPWSKLDSADKPGWRLHFFLKKFYAPLNAIDAGLFDGPPAGNQPLFEIGPPK